MAEYTIWVNTPGKGQIIVKIIANNATAAMEAAKALCLKLLQELI